MIQFGVGEIAKQKILIDVDDVLLDNFILPHVNEFFKLKLTLKDFEYEGAHVEYIFKNYPPEMVEKFYDFYFTERRYSEKFAKLKPHAIETVKKLNEKYDVFFCTDHMIWARPDMADFHVADKFKFLRTHFPFVSAFNHIYMHHKSLLCADVLIDDRPYNFGEHIGRKILFTAYHNKMLPASELEKQHLERADSWLDIEKMLLGGAK